MFRLIRNPDPRKKPPYGSRIDPTHPLAQGLVGCWLMNEGSGPKIVNLARQEMSNDLESLDWTPEGLQYDAAADRVKLGTFDPGSGGPMSIVVLCDYSGATGRHNQLVTKRSAWGSATMRWQFVRNDSGNLLYFESYGYNSYFSDKTLLTGKHQYVVTIEGSGDTPYLYIDEDAKVAGSTSVTFGSDTTSPICIGNVGDDTPGEGFDGIILAVLIYKRILLQGGTAQLHAEPYSFILVPQYWYMVDFGAAAGGGTSIEIGSMSLVFAGQSVSTSLDITQEIPKMALLLTGQSVHHTISVTKEITATALSWTGKTLGLNYTIHPAKMALSWAGQAVKTSTGVTVEIAKATLSWAGKSVSLNKTFKIAKMTLVWVGKIPGIGGIISWGIHRLGLDLTIEM